jgi:peptidoglycan/LPS O-acetylase OafA/YrhL
VPNFVMFTYCFYLGVALPKFLSNPKTTCGLGNGAVLLVALILLIPVEYLYVSNRLWMPYKFLVDTLVSGYVLGFILLRADCARVRFLDHPILVRLGDASYSFYCYAMPVLIIVAWALLMITPRSFAVSDLGAISIVLACILIVVTVSLITALISFKCIEIPCITIGRRWSERIEFGPKEAQSMTLHHTGQAAPR